MPKRNIILIPLCLILVILLASCRSVVRTPTHSPATLTQGITASPSLTSNTSTVSPSITASLTESPSPSATHTPTAIPTVTETPTPSLTPTPTSFPPLAHANWKSYTNGNYIRALLVAQDGSLWSGGSGGAVHWNVQTGEYVKYNTEHGLASNFVYAIAQDKDGAVWFGTDNGASRLKDGIWKTYTIKDGLAGINVHDIAFAPNGVLWFSTENGVTSFDGANWKSDEQHSVIIVAAPDGTIWSASGYSLDRYDGKEWASFSFPFSCEGQYECNNRDINALAIAPDNTVWLGTATTLYKFDGKNWTGFNPWREHTDVGVSSLQFDQNGDLWIGLGYYGRIVPEARPNIARTPGVYRYDGYNWKLVTEQNGLVSNEILAITQGPDNSLYFGSLASGITRFDGQNWSTFQTHNEPLSNFINALDVSNMGVVWLGHPQGVSRYDGSQWSTYTQFDDLGNDIDALCIALDETVWVSMWSGVAHFNGETWNIYPAKKYPWARSVQTITAWPDGKIFFGGYDGGWIYDGKNWNQVAVLKDESIYVALALPNGTLWAYGGGSPGGIYFYNGKIWYNRGHSRYSVDSIGASPDGRIWFGNTWPGGVLYTDGQIWDSYTEKDGLVDNYVKGIAVSPDKTVWFGTSKGLARFANKNWETFTTRDGLADNSVWKLKTGPDGALWIATHAGLTRYQPSPADLPVISKTATPTPTMYMTATPTPTRVARPMQIVDVSGTQMDLVPSGSFVMGDNEISYGEAPEHTVYLDDFYMDSYEVTNIQFAAFLNEKGNQSEGDAPWLDTDTYYLAIYYLGGGKWQPLKGFENIPVVGPTWFGAKAYCEWRGTRLPTEAEWEKAARGGLDGMIFPWGNSEPVCDQHASNGADYEDYDTAGSCSRPLPVGSFLPNGYGLYDMAGNVAEWVADWYQEAYYASLSPGVANPQGPDSGDSVWGSPRVVRGGSWNEGSYDFRVAARGFHSQEYGSFDIGFRCAYQP